MRNVKADIKGDTLIITCDISKATIDAAPASKSGKSKVVASTSGFTGYGPVKLSLNLTA